MIFQTDISKLKVVDLAVIGAVDSIHHQQSHECIVSKIDKKGYHFKLKANLNGMQVKRLFADRIPLYLPSYKGEVYEEDRDKYLRVYLAH